MQVVHSLQQGGSEALARDIALRLDGERFRPSVCALDLDGPLRADFEGAWIPTHVLSRRSGVEWRLLPKLLSLFRTHRVDVVQTHHLTQLLYAAAPARLAGARVIHVEHEYFSLRSSRARRRLRLLAAMCDKVVGVADEVAVFLVREAGLAPHVVTTIRNGVDVERYRPEARKSRETLGLPSGGMRIVGHVARLDPVKDQATLLRAFRALLEVCPHTALVISGDGPARQRLESMAAELRIGARVSFLGLRRDVSDLLPHFDAFALSSVNEGLPFVLLEAMACARPVVATAVGGIPTALQHQQTGLMVEPGKPDQMADALMLVLQRPEWAAELGAAARRAILGTFDLRTTVNAYGALYESAVRAV